MDLPNQDRPKIDHRRYVAALRLHGGTLADIARRSGRTQRHLQFILRGERPLSAHLSAALRDAVSLDGWLFATGQSDTLADAPASEVQSCR